MSTRQDPQKNKSSGQRLNNEHGYSQTIYFIDLLTNAQA